MPDDQRPARREIQSRYDSTTRFDDTTYLAVRAIVEAIDAAAASICLEIQKSRYEISGCAKSLDSLSDKYGGHS